jgi:acyl carrier protein
MSTLDGIKKIFKEKLDANPDDIDLTKTVTELGLDSLDMYEMIYEMENEFNVKIPDSEVANLVTIGDIVKFIDSKKA